MVGMLRFCAAAVCALSGGFAAHLVVLGKAGAIPFVILSAIGIALSLRGRFKLDEIGSYLEKLAAAAREIAGVAAKLGAFASAAMWFTTGAILLRLVYLVFGSSLLRFEGGIWEIAGWCLLAAVGLCFVKGAADWSVAFKGAAKLENEKVHGGAGLAPEPEAANATRGGTKRPPPGGSTKLNY